MIKNIVFDYCDTLATLYPKKVDILQNFLKENKIIITKKIIAKTYKEIDEEFFEFSFNTSESTSREVGINDASPYEFSQSMNQAFYFVEQLNDFDLGIELGDWLLVYQNNILVGAILICFFFGST